MKANHVSTTAVLLLAGSAAVYAVSPMAGNGVPHTFQAGTPARAQEVNENFAVLQQRIADLEALVESLVAKTEFISVDNSELEGLAGPHVIFEGVNVHVRSGSGATNDGGSPTGLGNLVVGYNELGALSPQARDGAHNLVLGSRNAYTSVGGIVAGTDNSVSAEFASITAGRFGTASGVYASISGGGGETSNLFNVASGEYSSVTGGFRNTASGDQASITGGSNHEASGFLAAISGGTSNTASGAGASVSGGAGNVSSESNASISGGSGGTASGISSTISGGLNNTVTVDFDCADCN